MNDSPRATQGSKKEYWKRHVENCKDSGLSQIQYCKDQQLAQSTFQYWKAKLNRQNLSRPLLPVTITSDFHPIVDSVPSGVSLSVKDRFNIQLDIGFNRETLLSVLDILEPR